MPPSLPSAIHGYSGKPLFQKLGLKPNMTCLSVGAPDHYDALLTGVEGVDFQKIEKSSSPISLGGLGAGKNINFDSIHAFYKDRASFEAGIMGLLPYRAPKAMLWVSWPKKSSPLFRDLTEDHLRTILLPVGLVDVKVCAVDQDWSGLKFLARKEKP